MSVGLRAKEGLLLVLTGLSLIQLPGCAGTTSLGTATPTPSTGGLTVPQMPSNVVAMAGDAQVTLAWSTSSGATSYHVKRATTNGGPYSQVAAPSSAGFIDSSLTNGTTYFYVVSAVSSAGESGNSPQVSAKPAAATQPQAPSTPVGLTALPGNAEVTLTGHGAERYQLPRQACHRQRRDLCADRLCAHHWLCRCHGYKWHDLLLRCLSLKLDRGERQLDAGQRQANRRHADTSPGSTAGTHCRPRQGTGHFGLVGGAERYQLQREARLD